MGIFTDPPEKEKWKILDSGRFPLKPNEFFIGWDPRRQYTICSYVARDDCENGKMWQVNGTSGGPVKPPLLWYSLEPVPLETFIN